MHPSENAAATVADYDELNGIELETARRRVPLSYAIAAVLVSIAVFGIVAAVGSSTAPAG